MSKDINYVGKVMFQGDVGYIAIDRLPDGLVTATPENGVYILGHSETGHHHVIEARTGVTLYRDPADSVAAYLQVIQDDVRLEHLRKTDTHEPHTIAPGLYQVLHGAEYSPEGWRRMSD